MINEEHTTRTPADSSFINILIIRFTVEHITAQLLNLASSSLITTWRISISKFFDMISIKRTRGSDIELAFLK